MSHVRSMVVSAIILFLTIFLSTKMERSLEMRKEVLRLYSLICVLWVHGLKCKYFSKNCCLCKTARFCISFCESFACPSLNRVIIGNVVGWAWVCFLEVHHLISDHEPMVKLSPWNKSPGASARCVYLIAFDNCNIFPMLLLLGTNRPSVIYNCMR